VSLPPIASREEWLAARRAVQIQEDEAVAQLARVAEVRRALPMVEIDTPYRFEGPDGPLTLLDLFDGRRTLVVYHFMFAPEWDEGCRYCSFNVDGIPHPAHFHARDVSFALISRAPMDKIAPFKARMGWPFPWVSSFGTSFNEDYYATLDGPVDPARYMYRDKAELEASGTTSPLATKAARASSSGTATVSSTPIQPLPSMAICSTALINDSI
jgi:predicted dithiol-disulfide oxidoreductase (DUF899 family)